MNSIQLLKQEINQMLVSLHDFVKWKLIVASALAATAMGLTLGNHSYSLLLLLPYVCAYVDLNCYQYLIRIEFIAGFLRAQGDDSVLQQYEREWVDFRTKFGWWWNPGAFASIGASVVISLAPIWALLDFWRREQWTELSVSILFWILGLLLLGATWWLYWWLCIPKLASLQTSHGQASS